jgi:hypothetical protein
MHSSPSRKTSTPIFNAPTPGPAEVSHEWPLAETGFRVSVGRIRWLIGMGGDFGHMLSSMSVIADHTIDPVFSGHLPCRDQR